MEVYGDIGDTLRLKLERSILRNFFVKFEFISQSYTVLFIEQFANTVFLESAMGYFRPH